ncbi:MAG TPA: TetR/AcrR family transcriptional regulator [Nocardioidaceae bacterium]|nr:TetR/AcrR family transcriptional regulator [Nocardioidaceae bacterium]
MTAERAYGGVSAGDRRAARRERLVEAVLDLVGAGGVASLTVTAVCRKAGLNERYFYESFADRNEALAAAADHVAEVLVLRILERLAAADEDQHARVTAAVGAAVDVLTDDPRKGALFLEAGSTPALAERRQALAGSFIELLLSQALATLHLTRTPEVEKGGLVAATHLFGGTLETIGAFLGGRLPVTRDELVELNVQMFLGVAGRVEHLFEHE